MENEKDLNIPNLPQELECIHLHDDKYGVHLRISSLGKVKWVKTYTLIQGK